MKRIRRTHQRGHYEIDIITSRCLLGCGGGFDRRGLIFEIEKGVLVKPASPPPYDWSRIVPNLLVSTAQHPQDITWTMQFSTSQDFKTEETTTVPVKSATSCPHVDTTTWPLAAAIFCRVRGSVVVKKGDNGKPTSQYFEATNWSPVGKISRVPFLPPPTSVVLAHNGGFCVRELHREANRSAYIGAERG